MERQPVLTPSQDDEHVLHLWEPLSFSVDEDYDYRRQGFFCRLGTGLLRIVVFVLLSVYNYVTLGMKIDGRENLKALRGRGAVTVCNHVHPMDCTMIDLAVFPRRIHYVTLDTNFRIPLVRHLIRWLGAVPLSRSPHQIARLFEAMGAAMDDGVLVQVYPEGVLIPYAPKLRKCKGGAMYDNRPGFCLERPHYPCSPAFDQFPSTVLRPGEEYHQLAAYRFGVK